MAIVRKKGVADVTKRGVADVTKKGVANVRMAYVPTPNSIWSLSKKVCWPSEISAGSPPAGFQKIISEVEAKCATFLKLRLG